MGNVIIGGEHKWAMRIWLDPEKLRAYGLAYNDVTAALARNNVQLPAGQLKSDTRFFNVVANGQMADPQGYADIVIREVDGVPVRIRDIGWAELGSESYDLLAHFNGKPVVGTGIVPQTKSNAVDISNAVHKALPELRQALPGRHPHGGGRSYRVHPGLDTARRSGPCSSPSAWSSWSC